MFVDTHCHLDDEKFKDKISEVVKEYLRSNVTKVINVGCNAETSVLCSKMAEEHKSIYFACGIHPMDVKDYSENAMKIIHDLCDHNKCVAVGEIGLDYYWDDTKKEQQKKVFVELLELAKQKKLPVSIHSRDATGDMLTLLKDNKDKLVYGGSLHCFSGSVETAKEILKLGLCIGFGGTLTFKNANKILDVAKFVPKDCCLTETDCPYLAPEPFRGTINEPKNIPVICDFLAKIKGISLEKMAEITYNNALKVFSKLS